MCFLIRLMCTVLWRADRPCRSVRAEGTQNGSPQRNGLNSGKHGTHRSDTKSEVRTWPKGEDYVICGLAVCRSRGRASKRCAECTAAPVRRDRALTGVAGRSSATPSSSPRARQSARRNTPSITTTTLGKRCLSGDAPQGLGSRGTGLARGRVQHLLQRGPQGWVKLRACSFSCFSV